MPTNEERKEVAARLREHKPKACVCGVLGWEYTCSEVESCEDCNALAMSRLADLIEPEPERACRPILHGNEFGLHDIHCGECCSLMLIQRDGTEEWPIYCCQCGTRVEVG